MAQLNNKRKVSELENEKNLDLVYKTSYDLNKSKSKLIEIGLEPENWNVGIKLISSRWIAINLNEEEWNNMVSSKIAIEKYFDQHSYSESVFIPIYTNFGLAIESSSLDGVPLLKISKGVRWMHLGKASFTYLFRMIQLIQMRIINLKNLNFAKYFEETLYSCIQMGGDVLDNMQYIVQPNGMIISSENLYCLNEILCLHSHIIIDAINKVGNSNKRRNVRSTSNYY